MKASLWHLFAILACCGCSETSGGDTPGPDASEDAITDGPAPDAPPDLASPDVDSEVTQDVAPDSVDAGTECVVWAGNVFAHEASRSDATLSSHGQAASVCSRAGVLPWVEVTWEEAGAACAAIGATLCEGAAWNAACRGEGGTRYPYGETYDPDVCNVLESPDGCLNECRVAATGQYAGCVSAAGAFDMSGNVAEWVADRRPFGEADEYEVRGGSYYSANDATIQCRDGHTWRPPQTRSPELGFRCCR